MPPARLTGLWRICSRHAVLWRVWDGPAVVYHDGSGDTHLLNPVAFAGLRALAQAPTDVADLARRVAGELNLPCDQTFENHMATLVTDLHRLNLVEAAAPEVPHVGPAERSADAALASDA